MSTGFGLAGEVLGIVLITIFASWVPFKMFKRAGLAAIVGGVLGLVFGQAAGSPFGSFWGGLLGMIYSYKRLETTPRDNRRWVIKFVGVYVLIWAVFQVLLGAINGEIK